METKTVIFIRTPAKSGRADGELEKPPRMETGTVEFYADGTMHMGKKGAHIVVTNRSGQALTLDEDSALALLACLEENL